jgi:Xaa-Pro aminopeptidase
VRDDIPDLMLAPGLDERDRRLARLRAAMEAEGVDALLVAAKGHWWTGRGYFRWLTDFHLWGHDGLILVPLSGDPCFTLSSYAVAERVAARGWIEDGRGDVYIAPRIADAVHEKGLAGGRIGLAGERFILASGTARALRSALPDAELVVADDLIDRARAVKSSFELRQEKALWRLAMGAMERFHERVRPGVPELDIAAEITRPVWAAGARDILIFVGEEPGAMNPPTPRPLRCDDKVRFHLEICGPSGHWCEITVNCAVQEPAPEEARLIEDELTAFEQLRALAIPGRRLSELADRFERVLAERGWRLGAPTTHFDFHGQGMDTIERPWFAAAPGWGASQDWPLEAGMVFSYHPRRRVAPDPGWSSGINEDIVITETGAERLSGGWEHRWRPLDRSA